MKLLRARQRLARRQRRTAIKPNRAEVNRTALQEVLGYPVQARLKVGTPEDAHEREADAVAERVMAMPEDAVQRKGVAGQEEDEENIRRQPENEEEEETLQTKAEGARSESKPVSADVASRIQARRGGGIPLPGSERAFFEPRLGVSLGRVRIHADAEAARLSAGLAARAFAVGGDVYFATGEYRPGSGEGRQLLAHELSHVLQQGAADTIRRVLELRPPGRGEASAFDRAQEPVDRLNRLTTALRYRLEGRVLHYELVDEARLNEFDRQMRALMDQAAVVPMRLITGAGYVQAGPGAPFEPALQDTWTSGYVDLDDLMASDDLGFKTQLVHFLTERAQTRNYERRIGSPTFTLAEFNRVHQRGYEAEQRVLRDEIGDPSLRYHYSEERPAGTWRVVYRSDEGYRIVKVFRNFAREIVPAETYALGRDGRRRTIAELMAERRAPAAPAPAPAPAAP